MIPLIVGAIAGALAVRTLQRARPAINLHKAKDSLRQASIAGLTSLEHSSARLRQQLAETQAEPASPEQGAEVMAEQDAPGEPKA